MKRNFTVILIILAISSLAFGQTKSRRNQSDEKTLLQIERDLSGALTKSNDSLFEKHLSETFVLLSPFGNLLDKPQLIEMLKYNSLRIQSSKSAGYKIQINDQTAIVAHRSSETGFYKFVDISGQYEWIDVFEKRAGRWQLIYKRGTTVR